MKYIKANFLNFLILIGILIFSYTMIDENQQLKKKQQENNITINKFAQAIKVSTDPAEIKKWANIIESLTEQSKEEVTEKTK
jgi:Na+/H+ antiporter NhaC